MIESSCKTVVSLSIPQLFVNSLTDGARLDRAADVTDHLSKVVQKGRKI